MSASTDEQRKDSGEKRASVRPGMGQAIWLLTVASLVPAFALVLIFSSGCDIQSCQEVQQEYERVVAAESGLVALGEQGPPHLAMAVRLDLVNDLTSGVLNAAIGDALGTSGTLALGAGQSANYSVSSTGADLRLEASSACDACLRIQGDFDGRVSVGLPIIGTQSSPLSGSMDWTVPLDVARDGDEVAIFLDTPEALRMGAPRLQASVDGLSNTWAQQVASALVGELAEQIAEHVDPLRLVGYELPDLGLGGVEITPSLFTLDASSNALVLGVRTNLDVPLRDRSNADFISALSLSDGQNIALGVQPGLIVESVRHGFRERVIPRRYSLSGEARRDGQGYVTVDDFKVGSGARGTDGVGLGLDFRVFNFRSQLGCFSMNGLVNSTLQIQNGALAFDVDDVEFTNAGALSDVANWGSAQFVEHTQGLVRHSLDDDVVLSPDVGVEIAPGRVSTEAGMLVLKGAGTPN